MAFGDLILARLPYWQEIAEDLAGTTFRFTRRGEPAWDEESGDYIDEPVVIYEGSGKVQTFQAFESEPEAGGAQRVIQRYYLHVPVAAGIFLPGDRAEAVESVSPIVEGNVYVVAGPHEKDWQTMQRLLADLDSGPS